jgi:hypothetical protein
MKEYEITLPDGIATTVQLSDEDARRRGLIPTKGEHATDEGDPAVKTEKAPANKARTPRNKQA